MALDFESYYNTKTGCSVKPLGAWGYCHHPEFYAFLVAVYDGKELWVGNPKELNWSALEGKRLISHNAFFDKNVYLAGVEKGDFPKIEIPEWQCTANMTAGLCNRRSLDEAVRFLFGKELDKGPRAEMDGKHWRDVKDTDLGKRFLQYAGVDAVECWNIDNKFLPNWSRFEQDLSLLTIEQCIYGVQIDVEKLEEYLNRAKILLFKIQTRMPWIADGAKPTSMKAVNELCRQHGIPCAPVKKRDGEEAYAEWEKTYAPRFPWISAVVQWRSLNKFISSLETIKARLRPDGTLSFGLKFAGAHTLRWSGDAGFNIQNLKRDPILVDKNDNVRLDDDAPREYWEAKEAGKLPDWLGTVTV